MKRRMIRYFKHIFGTLLVLLLIGLSFLVYENGSIGYAQNPKRFDLDKDGPYIFSTQDSLWEVQYIRGNRQDGFFTDTNYYPKSDTIPLRTHFALDGSEFEFELHSNFQIPPSIYEDTAPIFAISDIESGYQAFRDMLIQNGIINTQLEWTFEQGHLVLLGDFVDRGFSTTQVLWFIYKLEQEAKIQGGKVHFILGNHELKNLQSRYMDAAKKYHAVAGILKKHQHHLYDTDAFIGQWLRSKNTIEKINGVLFTHGGIHPDVAEAKLSLERMNAINRNYYNQAYYPQPKPSITQSIISTKTGLCWYRGYFKDELSSSDIDVQLDIWQAKAVVVGHTIQSKVQGYYNNKVIAIDVKHPKDYNKNWPHKSSEGLWIINKNYFRTLSNGEKIAL